MVYSPEEYEQLKAFYKEELGKRKAIQEQVRRALLRQKAEWQVAQMRASLERLGLTPESNQYGIEETHQCGIEKSGIERIEKTESPAPPSSDPPPKTLL